MSSRHRPARASCVTCEEYLFSTAVGEPADPQTVAPPSSSRPDGRDPIRERLLDAAVRVFAQRGYDGTRIMDIVRAADLSTGAVYGRFASKEDLLREAVVRRTRGQVGTTEPVGRVAELIARLASATDGPLTDDEAVRLEAYVAARREPEVAAALAEAGATWRRAVQPLVDAAVDDGSVAPDVDPDAVLYLVSTLRMGLLVQRAAGFPSPEPAAWNDLLDTIIASFGAGARREGTP